MFSSSSQLIGLELSEEFVTLQNDMVQKYQLADRVKVHTQPHTVRCVVCPPGDAVSRVCFLQQVLHSDVLQQNLLLQNADVLIMNNVFEFFIEPKEQVRSVSLRMFDSILVSG